MMKSPLGNLKICCRSLSFPQRQKRRHKRHVCAILKHYEGYIAKLCTRTLKDDAGNTYSYVDEEMRNRLQVRLITRTLQVHVG